MIYTLTLITGQVDHTHWWKNLDVKEPANIWWLTGGGLSRPATEVEVELWRTAEAFRHALKSLTPSEAA